MPHSGRKGIVMANLLENDYSMMYVGDQPWHKLGVEVQETNGVCSINAACAAVPVLDSPLYYPQACIAGINELIPVPDTYAVVRMTDNKVIGSVGAQAAQASASPQRLIQTATELLGGREIPGVSTAGFLRGGSLMWISLGLGKHTLVSSNGFQDETNYFFTLCADFCGRMSTSGMINSVRVVCNNTLTSALRQFGSDASDTRVKHTRNHETRLTDATKVWSQALNDFESYKARMELLASSPITDAQAKIVVEALFSVKEGVEVSTRTMNNIEKILHLYQGDGMGSDSWRGTAYGLLQATTEYATHHTVVRGARTSDGTVVDGQADRIIDSAMFGNGAAFGMRTFDLLTALVAP